MLRRRAAEETGDDEYVEESRDETRVSDDGDEMAAGGGGRGAADPRLAGLEDVELPAELRMDEYDEEMDREGLGFTSVVYEDNEDDPYLARGGGALGDAEEDDEDEDEDDIDDQLARTDDWFLCTGHTEEDVSTLEVHCYNRADGSLYVHHDITLAAFPLCMAWMDCPPGAGDSDLASRVGSYMAVGTFRPGIEIWNLDVLDPLEPTITLGGSVESSLGGDTSGLGEEDDEDDGMRKSTKSKKPKKTKKKSKRAVDAFRGPRQSLPRLEEGSHVDAVMGLSWNRSNRHLLASSSADHTVKLWDVLRGGSPLHTFSHHQGKVQSVEWHPLPSEASVLLSGSYDRTAAVLDARSPEGAAVRVGLSADVEDLHWDPDDGAVFVAAVDSGVVSGHDVRRPDDPLWSVEAHMGGTTSVSFDPRLPGILATAGMDKTVRLWDTSETARSTTGSPVAIHSRSMGIGAVFTASFFGYDPLVLACGGSEGKLAIWDIPGDAPALADRLLAGGRAVSASSVPSLSVRERPDGQLAEGAPAEMEAGPVRRTKAERVAWAREREEQAVLEVQAGRVMREQQEAAAAARQKPETAAAKRRRRRKNNKKN